MTTLLDSLRLTILAVGATGSALLAEHTILMLVIVAITVAATIGLYELTHREG